MREWELSTNSVSMSNKGVIENNAQLLRNPFDTGEHRAIEKLSTENLVECAGLLHPIYCY